MFSNIREPLTAPELRAPAVTRAEVLVAIVSIRFSMPMVAIVASMPTLQDENRNPWAVAWSRFVNLTPVLTSADETCQPYPPCRIQRKGAG